MPILYIPFFILVCLNRFQWKFESRIKKIQFAFYKLIDDFSSFLIKEWNKIYFEKSDQFHIGQF